MFPNKFRINTLKFNKEHILNYYIRNINTVNKATHVSVVRTLLASAVPTVFLFPYLMFLQTPNI
jgi:hypothetical protein